MKKAIVAAIAVAFFVSTAAEARGGRGFSGGRSFSRPAPTKSYAPKRTTGVSGFLCLGRLFQGQPNEAALCI